MYTYIRVCVCIYTVFIYIYREREIIMQYTVLYNFTHLFIRGWNSEISQKYWSFIVQHFICQK